MAETVFIVLFAVFAWWASTGAVLFLAHKSPATFKWTLAGGAAVLVAGFIGLYATRDATSVIGAYAGFAFGLMVWAWQEVSFYTGAVTGPRKQRCAPGCAGVRHFGHAVMASLYHELSILACLLLVVALTWGSSNQVGLWTFVVLLVMHESARLNVLLGVQNLSEEFVPEHLAVLRGFLTRRSMNLLFPVSVTGSTVAAVLLVQSAAAADASPHAAAGATFLATLLILAIIEHWFLVVPLPSNKLWSWSLTPPRVAVETATMDGGPEPSRVSPGKSDPQRGTPSAATEPSTCGCRPADTGVRPTGLFPARTPVEAT